MIRFPRRLTALLPFLLLAAAAKQADARPTWTIPALSSFNGSQWGDLQIGRTTFRQIRDRYETGKGAYERSTELSQPKNNPVRVDLLWVKQGEEEVLRAITVRFNGPGPRVEEIGRLYATADQPVETFFWPGRFEDWTVLRFARRGVAAMTLRDGEVVTTPLLVLTTPDAIGTVTRLSPRFTPVERRVDPHEDDPKVMEFDEIDVNVDLDDDLELPYGEKRRTVDQIEDASAEGTIRSRSRGDGSYKVKITGNNRENKGGSIYASVTISGNGPYGPITATGSGSDTWGWSSQEKKDNRYKEYRYLQPKVRDTYRTAVSEARNAAEASFARQMRDSGPPPLWAIREGQWTDIVNDARYWAPPTDIPGSILR
ncbi:hypothetical protein EON80_05095 [bacterium]|nr:MAG: hypothetical protein EON80_05095 [bacterium]